MAVIIEHSLYVWRRMRFSLDLENRTGRFPGEEDLISFLKSFESSFIRRVAFFVKLWVII